MKISDREKPRVSCDIKDPNREDRANKAVAVLAGIEVLQFRSFMPARFETAGSGSDSLIAYAVSRSQRNRRIGVR